MRACGVCRTDLQYREGGINGEFPFLSGHEAAGVVEAVGDGVTDVAPGDFVAPTVGAPAPSERSVAICATSSAVGNRYAPPPS